MSRRLLPLFALLLLLPGAAAAQSVEERFRMARELFDQFVYYEQRFDQKLLDLYADDAVITVIELRGDTQRSTTMSGKALKIFLDLLPVAAVQGQIFNYSNVTISPEGENMRILASRTSRQRGDTFPYQALVGPGPGGRWLIREETSVVRP